MIPQSNNQLGLSVTLILSKKLFSTSQIITIYQEQFTLTKDICKYSTEDEMKKWTW